MSAQVAVALVGTGLVGGALLRQLGRSGGSREHVLPKIRLVALANSRRTLVDDTGIAAGDALERLSRAQVPSHGGPSRLEPVVAALGTAATRVVVDATPAAAVAARHAEWLAQGIHVVSANKLALAGPLTGFRTLHESAARGRARYGSAATVGAGLPVLAALRRLRAAGDRLIALDGVCSGSLSFLFNRFDGTKPFSALVAEARELGYTEPDPRADLCGADVARKLLILARTAGFAAEERDVDVESLVPPQLRDVPADEFLHRLGELDAPLAAQRVAAEANGRVLRYLAHIDGKGRTSVRLQAVRRDHPCARLDGADNLFALTTTRYRDRPLVIQGPGAGPDVTAQALLADVAEIAAA